MYPAYYVICTIDYEIDGTEFKKGTIEWKPKECRPFVNGYWRRATESELKTYKELK